MRVALVCIAKNEDRYIREWVEYHLKLGFDKIYICCDEWECPEIKHDRVNILKVSQTPSPPQMPVYNEMLVILRNDFDFIAFLDIDEFLVLHQHKTVQDFLADKTCSVGINWVLFGDNGLTEDDGSDGVLKRFTKRGAKPNQHVKCFVKYDDTIRMQTPHNPDKPWLGSDGEMHDYAFCPNGNIEVAQINHYFCKTLPEWKQKQARGRSDATFLRKDSEFDEHNENEVDDFSARNFLYDLQ